MYTYDMRYYADDNHILLPHCCSRLFAPFDYQSSLILQLFLCEIVFFLFCSHTFVCNTLADNPSHRIECLEASVTLSHRIDQTIKAHVGT